MTPQDIAQLAEVHRLVELPANFARLPVEERHKIAKRVVVDLQQRVTRREPSAIAFGNLLGPALYGERVASTRRSRARLVTRHCLYHVCPLATNDHWQVNVRQLLKRRHAFNGRCVAAIAQGDNCLPVSEVVREFAGSRFEFIVLPNDSVLREVVSFLPLLLHVAHLDGATFYAHTKGNSTNDGEQGATYWRNAMYQNLLDRWPEAIEHLHLHFDAVGCHKFVWANACNPPYPSGLGNTTQHALPMWYDVSHNNYAHNFAIGAWHFSGTFFWVRNDVVFRNDQRWRYVLPDRYAVEAWPGIVVADHRRAKSMFQLCGEGPGEFWGFNPYDPRHYPATTREDLI